MDEASAACDAAFSRSADEIRLQLRCREAARPLRQGLKTTVTARRIGEGNDGRGVKEARWRHMVLLHLEAPADFAAS
jgi:hypothetical protein